MPLIHVGVRRFVRGSAAGGAEGRDLTKGREMASSKSGRDRIRVLVADDHRIIRQGLRKIMEGEPDMEVCGEAGSAREVTRLLRRGDCDVLVLDLALPDRSGLEVLEEALNVRPELGIVVLTMHDEAPYVHRALRGGARGYVTKDRTAAEIVTAIREVARGGRFISANLAESLEELKGNGQEKGFGESGEIEV